MGLFSKKTYVCEKCGKTYEKRINLNGNFCDACWEIELDLQEELRKEVGGYCDYATDAMYKDYTSEEMKPIIAHKNALLEKFKLTDGISRAELQQASDNYRKLTDEEAADVLVRTARTSMMNTIGAAYTDSFFVPTGYDDVIVDANNVFAVGFSSDTRLKAGTYNEVILCAVFTNDPYIPVFPMVYLGQKGLFELVKSKAGRASVAAEFESICPNLTYPVCDIKALTKTVKKEDDVRGNIEKKAMLDFLFSASVGNNIFNTKKMYSELSPKSAKMMESLGYLQNVQVEAILKMDKLLNRKYWTKQLSKL